MISPHLKRVAIHYFAKIIFQKLHRRSTVIADQACA